MRSGQPLRRWLLLLVVGLLSLGQHADAFYTLTSQRTEFADAEQACKDIGEQYNKVGLLASIPKEKFQQEVAQLLKRDGEADIIPVSYTHLRAHETEADL
eukprot:975615-Rhodomonas_salina.1